MPKALGNALRDPESALMSLRALAAELGVVEEGSSGDVIRLWLTVDTAEGPQRISLDIPRGKFDPEALLEMFEKHREAGTTRMLKV